MWRMINGNFVQVAPMAEESGAEGGGGGSGSQPKADDPGIKPQLPDDSAEFSLPDGSVVTYGELKKAHEDNHSLEQDHTRKTQEAADIRRQADEQIGEANAIKAEAEGDREQADKIRAAVRNDVVWYNTHDHSEWANYTPEIDKVEGGDDPVAAPNTNSNGTPAPVAPPVDEATNKRLDALEQHNVKSANELAVDATLEVVGTVVGSEGHELVTRKLLVNAVQAHQSLNAGQLPDAVTIKVLATEIQKDLADAGVPIPRGNISAGGSTAPAPVGEVAANVDPNWKSLSINQDGRKVEDALGAVLREKAALRG